MTLISCPDCHARVSDQATACPHCGHPIAASVGAAAVPKKNRQGTWRWILSGVIGAFVLAGVCTSAGNKGGSSTPAAAPAATPLPGVGQRSTAGEWAAELTSVQPLDRIGNEVPQGRFLIVSVGMTNLKNQTSTLNSWDFVLKSADGASFSPSGNGSTALAFTAGAPVLILPVQVQPGLTQTLRIPFDVNPNVRQYTLEAAKIAFRLDVS